MNTPKGDAEDGTAQPPLLDQRYMLANERTYLAWIRTALALIATGVAIEALAPPISQPWRMAGAVVFVVIGVACAVQAQVGWKRTDQALRLDKPLRKPPITPFLVGGVMLGVTLLGMGALV